MSEGQGEQGAGMDHGASGWRGQGLGAIWGVLEHQCRGFEVGERTRVPEHFGRGAQGPASLHRALGCRDRVLHHFARFWNGALCGDGARVPQPFGMGEPAVPQHLAGLRGAHRRALQTGQPGLCCPGTDSLSHPVQLRFAALKGDLPLCTRETDILAVPRGLSTAHLPQDGWWDGAASRTLDAVCGMSPCVASGAGTSGGPWGPNKVQMKWSHEAAFPV